MQIPISHLKKILLWSGLLTIISFISCNKKVDIAGHTTTSKPDTLTAGWSKVLVDTSEFFTDVFFVNPSTGYLSGKNCYKSVNGGVNWTKISYPLKKIINLAVTPDGKLFGANVSDTIFRTIDGGSSFTAFKTNSQNIVDISFVDNNTGYATTLNGLLQTTDGGASWSVVTPSSGLPPSSEYSSVSFINSTTGWISRRGNIYKTNGSVNNWVRSIFTGTAPTGIITDVFLYAVSPLLVYAGYTDGQIFKSVDGGITFTLVATLPTTELYGAVPVYFLDANNGYSCSVNRVYKTTDGGSNWQQVVALGKGSFIEIQFTDANNGWACTNSGTVVRFHQ